MTKKIKNNPQIYSKIISFEDNLVLPMIFGDQDKTLKMLEDEFNVSILPRGNFLKISGKEKSVNTTGVALEKIYEEVLKNKFINAGEINGIINIIKDSNMKKKEDEVDYVNSIGFTAGRRLIKPRSKKQIEYFNLVKKKEMVFCCGPAGTGKTYLAVAFAVSMLKSGAVDKIILTRPAVEAGERLGFLPGDLKEKIDPYLRPLYDALNDLMPKKILENNIESGIIEIAPLAFMRGRTLENAFIILDEAQNTTNMQMKMFVTRLGRNSKMVILGDVTQIDLPTGSSSGLNQILKLLPKEEGIEIINFQSKDIVRHRLVDKIVKAYSKLKK